MVVFEFEYVGKFCVTEHEDTGIDTLVCDRCGRKFAPNRKYDFGKHMSMYSFEPKLRLPKRLNDNAEAVEGEEIKHYNNITLVYSGSSTQSLH